MEKGIFYGVGVGPGDPELITVKAARVLRGADVIAVPDAGGGRERTAMGIAGEHIAGKELLFCPAPMGAGRGAADAAYDGAAAAIAERLSRGHSVAFITLGDPSVYSTCEYVRRRVAAMGYATVTVPGVTSFCAAAAAAGGGLCEGGQALVILPASCESLDGYLAMPGSKVIMKAGSRLPELTRALISGGRFGVTAVSNCGMANEGIARGGDALGADTGYFTTILLKDRGL